MAGQRQKTQTHSPNAQKPDRQTSPMPSDDHICIVTPYPLARVSGISQIVRELDRALAQSGVEVVGWCPASSTEPAGCRVKGVPLRSRNLRDLELAIRTASRILSARRAVGLVHAHQFHLQSAAALFTSRLIGRGGVLTIHVRTNASSSWRGRVQRVVDWVCLHSADVVTTVSAPVANSLRGHPVDIIPNGVDIDVFRPSLKDRTRIRTSLGLESDKVVVFAGRWSRTKGLDKLLAAFDSAASMHSAIHLLVIGEPAPDEPPIYPEAFVSASALDRVHVIGRLKDSAEVSAHLSAADLFALPSIAEGMPLALLEAMATGLPIVASDIGVHRALLNTYGCGWLVAPGDVDGLVRVLSRFAREGAPKEWPSVARSAAVNHHSAAVMARAYQAVYAAVLSKRRQHAGFNRLPLARESRPY